MAVTWRIETSQLSFSSSQLEMLTLFNRRGFSSASITRIFVFNPSVNPSSGGLNTLQIRRVTDANINGSTLFVFPRANDPGAAQFNMSNYHFASYMTVTATDIIRRLLWNNQPTNPQDVVNDTWEMMVPFATIFEAGALDTVVEPLVVRQGFGISVSNTGSDNVNAADVEFEFRIS